MITNVAGGQGWKIETLHERGQLWGDWGPSGSGSYLSRAEWGRMWVSQSQQRSLLSLECGEIGWRRDGKDRQVLGVEALNL